MSEIISPISVLKQARIFKAFCDENRLRILYRLQEGETCACELLDALCIGQSTLSHHMKILCDCGVVIARREGKWTHYSLSSSGFARAQDILGHFKMLVVKAQKG